MEQLLTKEECLEILDRYKNWNHGCKSVPYAFKGQRTAEDDIYDERRKLILAATTRLRQIAEGTTE